ncbi:MAG TPA: acyl-ACP thioesterase domain-containing protein [Ktedonobacterales bacterium]|nr:acyl-ACP thioesterase domain-containing protein [Ktedonobacterales bacterium]
MEGVDSPARGHLPQQFAPSYAFVLPLAVRSYEVTSTGQVSAATIFRYLEHVATLASADRGFDSRWYVDHGAAWVVREMQVRFGRLPGIGEELRLATWVSEFRRVQAQREYAICLAGSGRLVARASARWAYVDRVRGLPLRIPPEILGSISVLGHAMSASVWLHSSGAAPTEQATLSLTARGYESDTQQHINNCVYVDWLDEALRRSYVHAHAHDGKRLAPRLLRIEYARPVRAGDSVEIATAWTPLGARGLSATQEIRHGETGAIAGRATARYLATRAP